MCGNMRLSSAEQSGYPRCIRCDLVIVIAFSWQELIRYAKKTIQRFFLRVRRLSIQIQRWTMIGYQEA